MDKFYTLLCTLPIVAWIFFKAGVRHAEKNKAFKHFFDGYTKGYDVARETFHETDTPRVVEFCEICKAPKRYHPNNQCMVIYDLSVIEQPVYSRKENAA